MPFYKTKQKGESGKDILVIKAIMEEETRSSMTKDEVIVELMELLKKNRMDKQAGNVFEMTAMIDMLATKLDQMNHELVDMRMQIAKLTLQQVSPKEGRGIKESLSKMVEQAQARIDNLKEKLSDIRQDIKEKATEVVESAKEKGRIALDKLSNFFHIKEKLVSMREKVKELLRLTKPLPRLKASSII